MFLRASRACAAQAVRRAVAGANLALALVLCLPPPPLALCVPPPALGACAGAAGGTGGGTNVVDCLLPRRHVMRRQGIPLVLHLWPLLSMGWAHTQREAAKVRCCCLLRVLRSALTGEGAAARSGAACSRRQRTHGRPCCHCLRLRRRRRTYHCTRFTLSLRVCHARRARRD